MLIGDLQKVTGVVLLFNKYLFIILCQLMFVTHSLSQEKCIVKFEVISKYSSEPIPYSIIEIKSFDPIYPGVSGTTVVDLPSGIYLLEVKAAGHNTYYDSNFIISNNHLYRQFRMTPTTNDLFSFRGEIIDKKGNPISGATVDLSIGLVPESDVTDVNGSFNLFYKNLSQDVVTKYYIRAIKPGFALGIDSGDLTKNNYNGIQIKLKKINNRNSTYLNVGLGSELGLFNFNKSNQIAVANSVLVSYVIPLQKNEISIGLSYQPTFELKLNNTFKTLSGNSSNIATQYKFVNIGSFLMKWSHIFNNGIFGQPFIQGEISIFNIKPASQYATLENLQGSLIAYKKYIPLVKIGFIMKPGFIQLSPFMSTTIFKLPSQNFVFNYFGHATEQISTRNIFKTSLGLTVEFKL